MKKAPRRSRNAMTMHEVARLIGVSPMTVSRVLNDDPKVKSDTRERVQAAIKELGYAPNPAAQSLAKANLLRIGVVYSNPSAAYLNEFLAGLLEESGRAGCQIVLEKCAPRGERAVIEKMLGDGLSGLMLPPPLSDSKAVLGMLEQANMPFVAVAGSCEALSVRIDNFEAAAAMTRYLLSLGHKSIGFIRGAPNQIASAERLAGFKAALREAAVDPPQGYIKQGAFTYRSGLIAAEQLLAGSDRPTAIFASNDDMAAAAIAVAHRLRLEVPRDLTVVGFDDTPLATTIWPALTTVRQPIVGMARKALALLLEEIRLRPLGQAVKPSQHLMRFLLVKRESSAPAS